MARRTSLYDLLGVSSSATAEEIRTAYRRAARVLHPDAGGSAVEFERLTLAYHILADRGRRSDYDNYVAGHSAAGTGPMPVWGYPPSQASGPGQPGDAASTGSAARRDGAGRHRSPADPGGSAERFPGVSSGARRVYLAMMGVALMLFILAGTVVRPVSVAAAVAMALVAMVIPPVAAIVVNRPRIGGGPGTGEPGPPGGH
jgi:curved DNA-binding protein CbpA